MRDREKKRNTEKTFGENERKNEKKREKSREEKKKKKGGKEKELNKVWDVYMVIFYP